MLEFRKIEVSDKEWIDRLLKFSDYRGAEYNFTNLFIWDGIFKSRIARFKDFLVFRSGDTEERQYLYPAGRGDKREVIDEIMMDAARDESQLEFIGVTRETKEELEKMFPHYFKFTLLRESYDYIYDAARMTSLSGKKLQSKRNHINFFTRSYNWIYEEITPKMIPDIIDFKRDWCIKNSCKDQETLSWESCAVEKCLENFEDLDVKGAVLKVDGEIIAFTVGEVLNSDTVIVHIEKADSEVRGAYPMINKEFATRIADGYTYINREDDIGDEGLRKAKESYYPVFMLEKFSARLF